MISVGEARVDAALALLNMRIPMHLDHSSQHRRQEQSNIPIGHADPQHGLPDYATRGRQLAHKRPANLPYHAYDHAAFKVSKWSLKAFIQSWAVFLLSIAF